MATLLCVIGSLLAVCMIPVIVGESGTASPPSSAVDCSETTIEMMDCLSYVVEGSNMTRADKNCCAAIVRVVKVNPDCLCANLKHAKSMNLQINLTRAAGLPHECNIPVPRIGKCDDNPLPSPLLASSTPSSELPTKGAGAVPPAAPSPSGPALMKQPALVVGILVTVLVVTMSCSYII